MFAPGVKWDGNEMFMLCLMVFLIIIQVCLIRKLSPPVTVMIWLLNYYLVKLADLIIGVPPLNLYDAMDRPEFEWSDIFTHLIVYPILGYVFVYVYDRWKLHGMRLVMYIVAWSLVSVVFEWGAVQMGLFHYHRWKLSWSFPVYVTVFVANVVYYRRVREWLREVRF